jgi:hypothetical protein
MLVSQLPAGRAEVLHSSAAAALTPLAGIKSINNRLYTSFALPDFDLR